MEERISLVVPKEIFRFAKEKSFSGISRHSLVKKFSLPEQEARFWSKVLKFATFDDISEKIIDPYSPIVRASLIRLLRKPHTINHLSDLLSISTIQVDGILESLEQSGYCVIKKGNSIQITSGIKSGEYHKINPKKLWGRELRFGLVSDTHLCSKYERLDVLECAYDIFAKENIKVVYHAGNLVDGECRFNRFELYAHGITDQTLYALDHYPQRSGVETHFITADDHEGWWNQREGIDFGRYLDLEAKERGREDLVHLGYQEVDIELEEKNGSAMMRLVHPGGGSAYAISYAVQKIVESFQGGEKPQIVLCGHYHKFGYFCPREVHCVLTGCVEDQSRFMRKNKIQANVGFSIVSLTQADNGTITSFKVDWKPFFDRKYYVRVKI